MQRQPKQAQNGIVDLVGVDLHASSLTRKSASAAAHTGWLLYCLEDDRKFRSLRRHLGSAHGMTEAYRAKWDLPGDYAMTAPSYAAKRSELAREFGLGIRTPDAPAARAAAKRKTKGLEPDDCKSVRLKS
ncbi:MucR family transcriptional regulator [Mesorhizobium sp. M1393]|uniref:MucR family transcriptional regulator n=1 Tax=unclassified Mesorhizobium TaxID=325217 RepID=UPI0033398F51